MPISLQSLNSSMDTTFKLQQEVKTIFQSLLFSQKQPVRPAQTTLPASVLLKVRSLLDLNMPFLQPVPAKTTGVTMLPLYLQMAKLLKYNPVINQPKLILLQLKLKQKNLQLSLPNQNHQHHHHHLLLPPSLLQNQYLKKIHQMLLKDHILPLVKQISPQLELKPVTINSIQNQNLFKVLIHLLEKQILLLLKLKPKTVKILKHPNQNQLQRSLFQSPNMNQNKRKRTKKKKILLLRVFMIV